MGRLAGKVAIVTGGAQGIGRAIGLLFAQEGAVVTLADVQGDAVGRTAQEIETAHTGAQVRAQTCDVGEPGDIERLVSETEAAFGAISILVNNAAVFNHGTAVDMPLEEWTSSRRVIYDAPFLGARYTVPSMQRAGGGSIISISSVHGLLAARRSVAYEASKGALITLTKQMAVDFGPLGIRVNCICPGLIVTEKSRPRFEADTARATLSAEMYPLRRYGQPEDIARSALFLASDEASFITGHALVVDGGLTVQLQDDLAYRMVEYAKQAQ